MRQKRLHHITACLIVFFVGTGLGFSLLRPLTADERTPTAKGGIIFQNNCAQCHHADENREPIAPRLSALFDRETLPASGRPVTEENILRQLKDPIGTMPSFADRLTENEMQAVVNYLKDK